MSRAFLKNESADGPVLIPDRAPLPPGTPNYITTRGLMLLRAELSQLQTERARVQTAGADETERTRHLALVNGQIAKLNQRIASAKVVDIHSQPQNEIRFGATISLHSRNPKLAHLDRQLTIVGVDEADVSQGRIAFTAPLARLMLGKRVGEAVSLRTGQGENSLEIKAIFYEE